MPPHANPAITFLFTDIEGSTRLWEEHPEAMRGALAQHDDLLRACIESHGGQVFKTGGDAFYAAFTDPAAALRAALAAQQWLPPVLIEKDESSSIRVRMALHTGIAELRDGDYFGPTLNRVARLMAAGHGGQILLSGAARAAIGDALPEGAALLDRGSHRLKDLQEPEQIFQLTHPSLPAGLPELRTLSAHPNNLPFQPTSFVGRETVLVELNGLLDQTRLLCLTGSGGCGKSRLALQVAANRLEQFPDGVWLVELAPLADPGLVPKTVATVLGLKEERGQEARQTLAEYLQDRHLLLVLDNCEHLLDECAVLAETILRQCPRVTLVVTSREALRVPGETIFGVPSMAAPVLGTQAFDPLALLGYEATRLFLDRAIAALPGFTLTTENGAAVASVCRRLDGIPLAIELAAARVRALSPVDIDRRLDQRFRLLTGGSRTALPRQQTLRSLIDWSYDLLSEPERALLLRLSVFSGGWTLEAAESVCSDPHRSSFTLLPPEEVLDLLTRLVEKSLVVYQGAEADAGRPPRYRLLETVRQYARDRLFEAGETEVWRCRHRDHFLALAEAATSHYRSSEQAEWFQRLDEEHDNLRAALEWSTTSTDSLEPGLRLCTALEQFWLSRGFLVEGSRWCATFLALEPAGVGTVPRADVHSASGYLHYALGEYGSAADHSRQALAIRRRLGDDKGVATSLYCLAAIATWQSKHAEASALNDEALAIRRAIGDRAGIATSLRVRGILASFQSDNALALECASECLEICRELGDRSGEAMALGNMAQVQDELGNCVVGRALHEQSLEIDRQLGDKRSVARTLNNLGLCARREGNLVEAERLLTQALAIRKEIGDRWGTASTLCNLGTVRLDSGHHEVAVTLLQESLTLRRQLNDRRGIAFSLQELADAYLFTGDLTAARTHGREGLIVAFEIGLSLSIVALLRILAEVATPSNPVMAARLWSAAETLGIESSGSVAPRELAKYARGIGVTRSQIGDEAFSRAWVEGSTLSLEEAVALALQA